MSRRFDIRSFPYQPFFIAIFICISIYSPNRVYFPDEVMTLPTCILVGLIGLSLIILKYTQRDMKKSQIFISCTLLLNFTYYSAYDAWTDIWLNIAAPATIIYSILSVLLIAVIWKTTYLQADRLSRFLDFISIGLVLISFTSLAFSIISDAREIDNGKQEFEAQFQKYLTEDLTSPFNMRDFYFIVLDRYPGEDILYAENGLNNSDFYENLTSMGFKVLRKSRSNYGVTSESVPSMLNMDYFESLKSSGYNEENNRLWKFFKSQGFTFVFLPSNWITTTRNDYADVVLNPYPVHLDREFKQHTFQEIMFFERTLFGRIYYTLMHILFNQDVPSTSIETLQQRIQEGDILAQGNFCEQFNYSAQFVNISKIHIPKTFENLSQVPNISGRKFVFAHINHWEYLNKPANDGITNVNVLVESLVRKLVSESHPAPVIILLSDHGSKPLVKALEANRSIFAKYTCYSEGSHDQNDIYASWYPVNNLEALYLPDGGDEIIYPDMTPVNVWRRILNFYFGTDFQHADDKSYWYSPKTGICEVGDAIVSQGAATQPIGEILGNKTIGQTFLAPYSNLSDVEIQLATYIRVNTHEVIFHLRSVPSSSTDLYTIKLPADKIADNSFHRFSFDPITDSKGRLFYFFIESPNSTSGNAITIWYNKEDAYKDGQAYENGLPLAGDLAFRAHFKGVELGSSFIAPS